MRHRTPTQTVSFRLGSKAHAQLETRAKEYHLSPGAYARFVLETHLKNEEYRTILEVIQALAAHHDETSERFQGQFEGLLTELAALRSDFNRAVSRED